MADPNLSLPWLRSQGHAFEPFADWIEALLADRRRLADRCENLAGLLDEARNRIDDLEVELAEALGRYQAARQVISERDAEILSLYRKLDARGEVR